MQDYYKKYEPIFGSWKIVRLLGEGSFGKVYEIERHDFGTTYKAALKAITIPQNQAELNSIMADSMDNNSVKDYLKQFVEDIVGEFVLMSKLKGNSNVVSYEDHTVIEHKDGIGWDILIRMELLTPLLDYIKFNTITKRDVIKLGIEMCRALELCQKYNIIHRDIKPENIFVSDNGDFKLGDFGIARQVEKTSSGLSKKGTQNYMAPEVYRGEAYGTSVDIYSLGIVLYRLLNHNRAPFMPPYPSPIKYSDREKSLIMRMSGNPIPLPAGVNEGRLVEIAMMACEFDPKIRYSSPTQMREDLEAILYTESEGILMNPVGDTVDIKSVEYISNGKSIDQTELIDDATEIMTTAEGKSVASNTYPKSQSIWKKNKAISIVLAVVIISLLSIGIAQMSTKTIVPVSKVVSLTQIKDPVSFTFESSNANDNNFQTILKSRLTCFGAPFSFDIQDEKIIASFPKDIVKLDTTNFIKGVKDIASEGTITFEDASGDIVVTNSDFVNAQVKYGKISSNSEKVNYTEITLSQDGMKKLNIATTTLSVLTNGNNFINIKLNGELLQKMYVKAIIKSGKVIIAPNVSNQIELNKFNANLLASIINDGKLPFEIKVVANDQITELSPTITPAPTSEMNTEEWRVEGYETTPPYNEYARLYKNGVATEQTKTTGNFKQLEPTQKPSSTAPVNKTSTKNSQNSTAAVQQQAQSQQPAVTPAPTAQPTVPSAKNDKPPEVYVDFD